MKDHSSLSITDINLKRINLVKAAIRQPFLFLQYMKEKLNEIIFGTSTRAGRNFDLVLLVLILLSVFAVMIESVPNWRLKFGNVLHMAELVFTAIFTLEYITRIIVSKKPLRYIISFWGLIDLISILPSFISPFVSSYASLRAIRAFRLLRIFRILNLSKFTREAWSLSQSLKASYYKIMVFFFFVIMLMVFTGTLMYVIEGGRNGFNSIPESIYWAITTTTTVGYGDITPVTPLGKLLASVMMLTGYAIIAVPTGLISAGAVSRQLGNKDCQKCNAKNELNARYCNQCGESIA